MATWGGSRSLPAPEGNCTSWLIAAGGVAGGGDGAADGAGEGGGDGGGVVAGAAGGAVGAIGAVDVAAGAAAEAGGGGGDAPVAEPAGVTSSVMTGGMSARITNSAANRVRLSHARAGSAYVLSTTPLSVVTRSR